MGPSRPGTPDDALLRLSHFKLLTAKAIVPVKALEPLAEDSNGCLACDEATAKEDFGKWYAIPGPGGREYYCNSESGLTMWEHPAEVLLPAQYMKMRAAERLLDDSYVTDIMMLSAAATNESGGSFYSKGVMGSTASTAAPGFRKALTADGDMDAEDVQIQLAQTVMELEKERANTEKLRSYCAGLSDRMEIAEKNAQEASSLFSKAEQTQLLERTHAEEARAGLDAEVKAKFELTVADLEAERARANQASEKCAELETRHKLAEERAQEADLRFSQSQLRLDEMAVTPSVPQPDPEVHGRLSRAEAELEAERVRTKQARAMCDDLRNSHQKALEDVQEARLAEEQVLSRLASVQHLVQLALEELRCATPATPGSNFLDTLEEGRERDEQALPSKEGSVISNDATGGTGDRALSRRVAQEQQDQQNKEVQQQYEEAVRRAEQAIAEHAELAQRHQAALAELKEAEGAKDSAIYRVTELEKEVQHQAAEAAVEISTAAAERQNYERQLQELRGQLERKHEEENTLQVTQDLQLEETKRDLGKQLLDATSSSNAYQEQLEKTALELFHSKLSGEQVAERADRIEAELLVGTVRLEQADAECSTWRSRHEAAVNEVAEAEAARKSLEGTLDHLRHELKDMEAALSAGGDDRIAVLQAALANEQHRLDELLQSQAALDRNKQQLESQLQDAAASTRALQAKLAQTTDELGSAQSAKEDALNCKARAEAESQHALQLAQAAETARLEIEARLKEMESTQKLESTQMPFPPSLASPPVVASDEVELEPPNLEQHVANASEEISLESTQMPSPPELPPPPAVTSDEVELEPPKLKEIPLEATQMPFAPKPPPPPDVKPPPPPDVAPDEVVLDPPPVEQAGLSASVELKIPGTTTGLERKRKTAYGRSGDKAARMAAALLAQQIRQIRAESELTRRQIEDAERFAQDLEYGVGRPSRQVMLKLTAAKGSSANFNRNLVLLKLCQIWLLLFVVVCSYFSVFLHLKRF
ncbi:unnamed protein product [Polarella glacialis]|uniref:WW domain-containing protein n=1 Tax=Polarella glacialis TaxID=89957 RepID=A0A813G360_POLGL|nr:unnamed protein product [Polarella glacialis]